MRLGAQVQLDYSRNPLVYETTLGDASTERTAIVSDHLVAHLGVSLGLWDRLTLSLGVPISVVMEGNGFMGVPPPDGTSIGDPRIGARVRILGERADMFSLGASLVLSLPLAGAANSNMRYAGDNAVNLTPKLLAELRVARMRITANVGALIRSSSSVENLDIASALTFGLGVTIPVMGDELDVHGELYGVTEFSEAFSREQTFLEALVGLKWHVDPSWTLGVAGGPGLARGYGTPDFRALLSLGFLMPESHAPVEVAEAPALPEEVVENDRDHDGILNDADQCADEPEDRDSFEDDNGCPDADNDRDRVLDAADGAPNDPEDADGFEDGDGVPEPDNDHDGILDAADQCPLEAEDRDRVRDEDGCPETDADSDQILDPQDHCPLQSGPANTTNPVCNGCPGRACITEEGSIQILDRVEFGTDSDVILAASNSILTDVHDVMVANTQLLRIRVEGHTDDRGNDARNLDLSQRRAQSVVRWLVEHGIAAERLEAQGYGETRPLQTNATPAGRQTNRRVEFHVVDPAPPEAAAHN